MENEARQAGQREQSHDSANNDGPELHWFQFHWLTILVLVLMVAVLFWANYRRRRLQGTDGNTAVSMEQRGWPWSAVDNVFLVQDVNSANPKLSGYATFSYEKLGRNLAVALISLIAVGLACERIIRRKSAKAKPPKGGPK